MLSLTSTSLPFDKVKSAEDWKNTEMEIYR